MLKFYYTMRSPYARKVRILLTEMGTEHQAIEISPGSMETGSLFGEEYEALVPSMRIPGIRDGDEIIFESNFILAYLLEKHPMTQSTGDQPPMATVMVRSTHQWQDNMVLATIETLLNSAINLTILKRFGVDVDGVPYLRREQARCQSCLDWLEARATPEGFIPGVFSIADINLMCALQWFDDRDIIPWWGRPRLETIVARYQNRPSVKSNPLVYQD
jgi:glutathione S-transferase